MTPDMGWSKYISDIEDSNNSACMTEAARNGYSEEQAEMCDDGDLGCKNCPWKE